MPLEETINVLVLFIHQGSSFEQKTCYYSAIVDIYYRTKILIFFCSMIKLILILLVSSLSFSQTPPTLPPQFTLQFNETAKLVTSGNTKGAIYYDLPNNRQVVTRQTGKFDRYCGSVFKLTDTPCNHIILQNKRFLDFPQKQYCCFCCDSTHGCGILLPDWLIKGGATYNGTEQLDQNGPYQKWQIKGLQQNFYYNKNDSNQTPRRLFQVSDDLMDFTKYSIGPVDAKKFVLPDYCTSKCGLTTICAGLRGQLTK